MYGMYGAASTAVTIAMVFSLVISIAMCVLFVWLCKKIAVSKGLSKNYMWFGLLGVIGIIIVAVIQGNPQNNNYGYNQPNQYGQNPYGQPNQYGQNPYGQQNMNQGFTLNGQQYTGTNNVTTCSKCGASMSGESDFCPFCGNKVK